MKINLLGLLVFLISFFFLSLNIAGLSIYALDEAKNAECAREMLERGDWIVPTFNYQLRGDKPPLHYFFMMLGYALFGVTEFAARFFSSFFGAATIWITFFFADKWLNRRVAWLSLMILLASMHFSIQMHMAVPDPYLIFFVNLGLFAFYSFYRTRSQRYLILMYVALALGTLCKGPVALALPGLIALVFLIFQRKLTLSFLGDMKLWWGIPLFLIVSLPWYIAVHIQTEGAWTQEFFLEHNVSRFSETMEGHGGSPLLTLAFVGFGLIPFSIYLPQALAWAWKQGKEIEVYRFGLWVILCIIGFFAISSTKLPNYTVPSYPFLAILIAAFIYKLESNPEARISIATRISLGFYTLIAIAVPIGFYFAMQAEATTAHLAVYALGFLLLPLLAIWSWVFVLRNYLRRVHQLMVLSWLGTLIVGYFFIFPQVDKLNAVTRSLPVIDKERPLAFYQIMNPAFLFYVQKPFKQLDSLSHMRAYLEEYPEALVISRRRKMKDLDSIPSLEIIEEHKDLFEKYHTILLETKGDSLVLFP